MGNYLPSTTGNGHSQLRATITAVKSKCERITVVQYPLLPGGILAKRESTGEILFVEELSDSDATDPDLMGRLNTAFDINGDNVLRYYDKVGKHVFREIYDITLTEFLKGKRLFLEEALSVMIQCANGIKTLQDKEVEHWQLSMDNIGIKGRGVVKLFDYHTSRPRPQTTVVLEARRNRKNDKCWAPEIHTLPKADIYSLARVFELVLDHTPKTQSEFGKAGMDISRSIATIAELISMMKGHTRPDIVVVITTLENLVNASALQTAIYGELAEVIKSYNGVHRLLHIHFNIALIGTDDANMKFIKEMQFRQQEMTKGYESEATGRKVFYVEIPWMPNIKIWNFPEVGLTDLCLSDIGTIPWQLFELVVVVGRSTRIHSNDVGIVKALKEKNIQYVYVRTDTLEPFTSQEWSKGKESISKELLKPEYFQSHPPMKFFFIPPYPTNKQVGSAVGDRAEMFEFIRSKLMKPVEIKIAFLGESGVGKSTTINTMRGLKDEDEGAAKTDKYVTGTQEVKQYSLSSLPSYPNANIIFYDFPGIAPDFSILKCKSEIKRNALEKACFLIFHSEDRKKDLKQIIDLLLALKCEFVIVRSFCDVEVDNLKYNGSHQIYQNSVDNIARIPDNLANDIYTELQQLTQIMKEKVYLINCKEPDQFEYPKLWGFIMQCLSTEEQEAFLGNIGLISLSAIDAIAAQQLDECWRYFGTCSGVAGIIPYLGVSTVVDFAIFEYAHQHYIKAFKLDDKALMDLAARTKVKFVDLKSRIKHTRTFDRTYLSKRWEQLTKSKAGLICEVASEGVKFIQKTGRVIGGAINPMTSYYLTTVLLRQCIEEVKKDAITVYTYARDAQSSNPT